MQQDRCNRDPPLSPRPRFITIPRGGTLKDSDHQLLALWAAAYAEHVLLLSTGVDRMSYVRCVPALQVKDILTAENDVQQELAFVVVHSADLEESVYPGMGNKESLNEASEARTVMLHFAITRPAGAIRDEVDANGDVKSGDSSPVDLNTGDAKGAAAG